VISTSVKLGTSDICNAGCADWPCTAGCSDWECKAGCQGIDVAICTGGDYVLCKGGCFGISSCVHKCEHAIVDPCKNQLINACSHKCEAAFGKCKSKCETAFGKCKSKCDAALTMQIQVDFERLQHAVSSMSVSTLNVNCTGNGITSALSFQSDASIHFSNVALSLKAHITDAGITTNNDINLENVAFTLAVPLSGYLDCGIWTHNISMSAGKPTVLDFNLDVHTQLDKTLATLAAIVGGPVGVIGVKDKIASAIKSRIMAEVPAQVAKNLQPVLQKLLSELKCPRLPSWHEAFAKAKAEIEGV